MLWILSNESLHHDTRYFLVVATNLFKYHIWCCLCIEYWRLFSFIFGICTIKVLDNWILLDVIYLQMVRVTNYSLFPFILNPIITSSLVEMKYHRIIYEKLLIAIKWRFTDRIAPDFQEMLILSIRMYGPNIKSFGQFKGTIFQFCNFAYIILR